MDQIRCRCLVKLRGTERCMHSKHASYKLPVIQSVDCQGCPLKVNTDEAGKPVMPSKLAQVAHFGKDMTAAAADGFTRVSQRCKHEREMVCMGCPMLSESGTKCTACGCSLPYKRSLRAWKCDLGYWDHIPVDIQPGDELPEPTSKPSELKE